MIPVLILNLAGLTAISILLAHYWSERRILSAFVHRGLPQSESAFATALDLAGLIHAQVPRANDPRFIPIAVLDFLGGTPVSILRRGGCCSGLSRLYITGLGTLGIKAAQVTLYHVVGLSLHALVEVSLGEQRVVVDPTYGFYYVDSRGGHISLDALRRGAKPQYRRLPNSSNESYPANDYYNWDFSVTKIWTFHERFSVQLRGEFFNILNHPNFNAPGFGGNGVVAIPGSTNFTPNTNGTFGSGTFGRSGSTRDAPYDPRQIQLALKMYF